MDSLQQVSVESHSVAHTRAIGADLAERLEADRDRHIVLLDGDMGVGKTELIKGMGVALGIDEAEIQSPTYSLIHEYRVANRLRLVHIDLYRVEVEQLDGLGLDELLGGPGIKAIEWWSKLGQRMPGSVLVRIDRIGRSHRSIAIET